MSKYRAFMNDLDRTFSMDNGMAYKFLTFYAAGLVALCVYSIVLDFRVM